MILMMPAVPLAQAHGGRVTRPNLVVIVNPAAHLTHMTNTQITDIFMGRQRQLPTGAPALPIDLADEGMRA